MESVARRRNRLLCADDVQEEILERDEDVENLVTHKSDDDEESGDHGVHEIVVGRCNNGRQDESGVSNADQKVEDLPECVLARLPPLQRAAEEARVVNQGHSNAERVSKVHRGHGCQRVDIFAAHPDALRIIVSHSVEETILLRKQPRRHAGVDDKGNKGTEICECHCSAGDGEGIEGRSNVVVPADEAKQSQCLSSGAHSASNTYPTVPGM